jgi:hypothetical protein
VRSKILAGLMGGGLALVLSGVSLGAIGLTPSSQTHNHGVASSWTGTYGNGMQEIKFCYGDGGCKETFNPSGNSMNYSHTFWPCFTTTYTQSFSGYDLFLTYLPKNSTSRESGGSPC